MKALVLSGGAARGAYQVGVLKRLMFDEQRDYEILCGVSAGALNVLGLSKVAYGDPKGSQKAIENIWLSIKGNVSIYKKWFPFNIPALWMGSFYDHSPLARLIDKNIDAFAVQSSGRKVAIGAVSMTSGTYKVIRENEQSIKDWLLASCSIPLIFPSVQIDGELWADGGLNQNLPLAEAIRFGAKEIDVICCSNPLGKSTFDSTKRYVKLLDRSINLMTSEMLKDDIRQTGLMNDLADLGHAYKHVKVRLFVPSRGISNNSLDFDPKIIREYIELGYNDSLNPKILGE